VSLQPLPPELEHALDDLTDVLRLASGFTLVFAVCESYSLQRRLMKRLYKEFRYRRAEVDRFDTGVLDQILGQVRPGRTPLMVTGLDYMATPGTLDHSLLRNLNLSRPRWPVELPRPVVVWGSGFLMTTLALEAPDFFRFRSHVIEFPDVGSAADARIKELRYRVEAISDAPPELRIAWYLELAKLTNSAWWYQAAVDIAAKSGLSIQQPPPREMQLVLPVDGKTAWAENFLQGTTFWNISVRGAVSSSLFHFLLSLPEVRVLRLDAGHLHAKDLLGLVDATSLRYVALSGAAVDSEVIAELSKVYSPTQHRLLGEPVLLLHRRA
jgi:hypothetical protein